jgi:hypothetical protein
MEQNVRLILPPPSLVVYAARHFLMDLIKTEQLNATSAVRRKRLLYLYLSEVRPS